MGIRSLLVVLALLVIVVPAVQLSAAPAGLHAGVQQHRTVLRVSQSLVILPVVATMTALPASGPMVLADCVVAVPLLSPDLFVPPRA